MYGCINKDKITISLEARSLFHLQNPMREYVGFIEEIPTGGYYLSIHLKDSKTRINGMPIHCYNLDIAKRKFKDAFSLKNSKIRWKIVQ